MDTPLHSPAVEAFWRYTKAFQSLDSQAIPPHFNEPAMMITPKGIQMLPNAAAIERAYASIMAELPAQRYSHTEFSPVEERRLGDDLTVLTGSGNWVDVDGRKFMPFGMTYTMRRTGSDWRIVVAIIHSADAK